MNDRVPIQIQDSLVKFHARHPFPEKTGFVIMSFGQTKAHIEILSAVNIALFEYGLTAV